MWENEHSAVAVKEIGSSAVYNADHRLTLKKVVNHSSQRWQLPYS